MKEKELNFEDKLCKAADKLRKKVEVHEYKYVVLELIFLKYLSFAFEEKRKKIEHNEVMKFPERFRDKICEDFEKNWYSGDWGYKNYERYIT